ncbi:MAG: tetratricopeptide repeat protein [Patescibacteria group bacterium]|jgi:tetratricopeptide (TPR) repeat protein
MYNIIPLILILLSLAVMTGIVVRKFSALANLDIESIPAEKESRFKERIIGNRLKRNLTYWNAKTFKSFSFIGGKLGELFSFLLARLLRLKEKYRADRDLTKSGNEEKTARPVLELLNEADAAIKSESYEEAEKKLIEIISLQSRNLKAFKKLGGLYSLKKQYEEARQSYAHILKLIEDEEAGIVNSRDENSEEQLKNLSLERGQVYFELSRVFSEKENYDEAAKNMKEALKIEPLNPKYLDTMIEISIIGKDKIAALDALKRLEKANPENQKLKEFKERIGEL